MQKESNMRAVNWLLILWLLTANVCAANPFGLGIGTNVGRNGHVPMDFYRATYHWDWHKRWFEDGAWYVDAHSELSVIRVISDVEVEQRFANSSLSAIAFTPIFRLRRIAFANGFAPYVEAGIGVAYFSESKIQSQPSWFRDYGGRFQFEDRISFGALYKEKYTFSIDYTHYSNADISPPNEGLDLVSLSVSIAY